MLTHLPHPKRYSLTTDSTTIRKNRPDSNRIFRVYFESGVIEYVRTLQHTRRSPIRIRANSGPNIWLFAQCSLHVNATDRAVSRNREIPTQ